MDSEADIIAFAGRLPQTVLKGVPLDGLSHAWLAIYLFAISLDLCQFSLALGEMVSRKRNGNLGRFFYRVADPSSDSIVLQPNITKHWLFWTICYSSLSIALNAIYIYCLYHVPFESYYYEPLRDAYLLCMLTAIWFPVMGMWFSMQSDSDLVVTPPSKKGTSWYSWQRLYLELPSPPKIQLIMFAGLALFWVVFITMAAARVAVMILLIQAKNDAVAAVEASFSAYGLQSIADLSSVPIGLIVPIAEPIFAPVAARWRQYSQACAVTFALWGLAVFVLLTTFTIGSTMLLTRLRQHIEVRKESARSMQQSEQDCRASEKPLREVESRVDSSSTLSDKHASHITASSDVNAIVGTLSREGHESTSAEKPVLTETPSTTDASSSRSEANSPAVRHNLDELYRLELLLFSMSVQNIFAGLAILLFLALAIVCSAIFGSYKVTSLSTVNVLYTCSCLIQSWNAIPILIIVYRSRMESKRQRGLPVASPATSGKKQSALKKAIALIASGKAGAA